MYIYHLGQDEPFIKDIYLTHEKKFTDEEFKRICKEIDIKYIHSHIAVICKHLEKEYGFKNIADLSIGYYEYNPLKC